MEQLIAILTHINQLSDVDTETFDGRAFIRDDRVNVELIEELAQSVLITDNGQLNTGAVSVLVNAGFHHRVMEADSHGPLVGGIKTTHGWVTYG